MHGPIAIVDCNNFYASCERVFNPKLKGKAIVVLSNNDGIIIARSNEAKALGIKMGDPLFKVQGLVNSHKVEVFSSNYTLYGDMSHRVMTVIESVAPNVEIYSVDEAFVDLSHIKRDKLVDFAKELRNKILKSTGIPVSIGIAGTKTLAKVANRIAKKNPDMNGVLSLIDISNIDDYLAATPIEDVWGVGRKYSKVLKGKAIYTALDFTKAADKWIKQRMTVVGLRTVLELRGIPCIKIEHCPANKKAILSSRSFGKPATSIKEIKEAAATYTSRAAEKLRRQGSCASHLSVFLRTNPFKDAPQYHNGVSIKLPVPTDATNEMLFYVEKGVEQIFREGYEYQKVGVCLAEFSKKNIVQQTMFDTVDRPRLTKLMKVLDGINDEFGSGTLFFASSGVKRTWSMKRNLRSPRYTTSWKELPNVKA